MLIERFFEEADDAGSGGCGWEILIPFTYRLMFEALSDACNVSDIC